MSNIPRLTGSAHRRRTPQSLSASIRRARLIGGGTPSANGGSARALNFSSPGLSSRASASSSAAASPGTTTPAAATSARPHLTADNRDAFHQYGNVVQRAKRLAVDLDRLTEAIRLARADNVSQSTIDLIEIETEAEVQKFKDLMEKAQFVLYDIMDQRAGDLGGDILQTKLLEDATTSLERIISQYHPRLLAVEQLAADGIEKNEKEKAENESSIRIREAEKDRIEEEIREVTQSIRVWGAEWIIDTSQLPEIVTRELYPAGMAQGPAAADDDGGSGDEGDDDDYDVPLDPYLAYLKEKGLYPWAYDTSLADVQSSLAIHKKSDARLLSGSERRLKLKELRDKGWNENPIFKAIVADDFPTDVTPKIDCRVADAEVYFVRLCQYLNLED